MTEILIKSDNNDIKQRLLITLEPALTSPLHILLGACRSSQLCADKQQQLCAAERQKEKPTSQFPPKIKGKSSVGASGW